MPNLQPIYFIIYFTKIPAKWWIHLEVFFPGEILGILLVQYIANLFVDVKFCSNKTD